MPGIITGPGARVLHGPTKAPPPNPALTGVGRSPIPGLKMPGSRTPNVGGLPVGTINVSALQQFLNSKGYDLKVDGVIGRQTRAALADFGVGKVPPKLGAPQALTAALHGVKGTVNPPTGLSPAQWNQHYGTTKTKSVVTSPVNATLDPQGNVVQGAGGPPVDLRALQAIAAHMGTMIPQGMADELANNTAGAQFDPQIHDAQVGITQAPRQAAQNQADIGNWYGQVQGAEKTAAGRDHAISSAGVDSQRAALAAIISSLGGAANEGSASVGASGENSIGTLQALGGIQDQYNQDLAPLLKLAQSGAATGQQARDEAGLVAQQQHLADLQGQRGQVQGATKADMLMKIIAANNATGQQNFQNRLNVSAAAEAAQMQGLKVLLAQQKAATFAPRNGYAGASTRDLSTAAQNMLSGLKAAGILDPTTGKLASGRTPSQAIALGSHLAGGYFQGGAPVSWVSSVLSPYTGG